MLIAITAVILSVTLVTVMCGCLQEEQVDLYIQTELVLVALSV